MKLLEIAAFSGGAFTNTEITLVKNILLDQNFEQTKTLLSALTIFESNGTTPAAEIEQGQRKLIRSQIKTWYDKFQDGTLAVKGGKRGTDYSNLRDKENLRGEIRKMLGLPEIPPERLAQLEPRRTSSTSFSTRTLS